MLIPEQIKKLIEVANPEGVRIKYDNVSKKDVLWFDGYCVMFIGDDTPRIGLYYLFLQKCIEGINRCNPEYLQIAQCGYSIQVLTDCNREVLLNINLTERNGVSIEEAKEQALIYILDNIQKQD